jgi:hypothetical protein
MVLHNKNTHYFSIKKACKQLNFCKIFRLLYSFLLFILFNHYLQNEIHLSIWHATAISLSWAISVFIASILLKS